MEKRINNAACPRESRRDYLAKRKNLSLRASRNRVAEAGQKLDVLEKADSMLSSVRVHVIMQVALSKLRTAIVSPEKFNKS